MYVDFEDIRDGLKEELWIMKFNYLMDWSHLDYL